MIWTYGWQGWVLKTNSSGSVVFNSNFGGNAYDIFNSVAECSDGGYILAGQTGSYGAGSYDGWVMKVNSSGFEEWNYTFGGSYSDYFNSVAVCPDGGFILAGRYDGVGYSYTADGWVMKLNSFGSVEWNKTYEGTPSGGDTFHSIILDPVGGFIVAGSDMQYYPLYGQGWITKLDSNGDVVWNSSFGDSSVYDSFYSVAVSQDGGYVLVGRNDSAGSGGYLWAVKVNSSGGLVWDYSYGGNESEKFYSVVNCSDGGFVIAGCLGQNSELGVGNDYESYICKINSSGGVVWSMVPGGSTNDGLYGVANCSDGGYILAGYKNVNYYDDGWALKLYYPLIVNHTVNGTVSYHGAGQSGAVVNVTTSQGTYSNTTTSGGAYVVPVQIYDYPGESIYVESSYGGCNNTTSPISPAGSVTTIDVDIAPPENVRLYFDYINYCSVCYEGATVNVTTNIGSWVNVTDANGKTIIDMQLYRCPADNVILNVTFCGSIQILPISNEIVVDGLIIYIGYDAPRTYMVSGNVSYHGLGQDGAVVNVTTSWGSYGNVTGLDGAYMVQASVCDCQAEAIYDNITVNASYNGCSNTTGPFQLIDDNITFDVDLTPLKSHTVSGTITFHGVAQSGASVSVTTNAGTYTGTSGTGGTYSITTQIYECPPTGDIIVTATYNGKTNSSTAPATGSATTINVDIEPKDPCDCVAHGYYPQCTYWLLPGCNQPAPPGYNPQSQATSTEETTTTSAVTTTTTTTSTTTTTTTDTMNTTVRTTESPTSAPTSTTATTTTPASGVLIAILCGLFVIALARKR